MSTTSQLIEFAKSSGAFWMNRGTGIALTWDSGIYWHNLWTEHDDRAQDDSGLMGQTIMCSHTVHSQ